MRAHWQVRKPPRRCERGEPYGRSISARPVSGLRVSVLGAADPGRTGAAVPLYPPGALRQRRPGAQPAGKLCGHPFAAQRAAALLSAIRGRQGRDAVPPVRRGGVHPVCLLRDGRGEHRPVHRCRGGHRGAVHQRGHLPTADAGKRLCALLRLPDDGRALF